MEYGYAFEPVKEDHAQYCKSPRSADGQNGAGYVSSRFRLSNSLQGEEIRGLEEAQDGSEMRRLVGEAVKGLFPSSKQAKRYVAALVLDAKGDLQIPGNTSKYALSDGLGIVGSRSLYTLPSCVEEVVPTVSLTFAIPRHFD